MFSTDPYSASPFFYLFAYSLLNKHIFVIVLL
nr:MAG TPA: hypothetical protein [Caudoviricetes sp.]